MAIASRAQLMRSPADRSMSISRSGGSGVTSRASSTSSSVVSPRALTTALTLWPCSKVATMRRATLPMRVASATDEPPYFWTTTDKVLPPKRLLLSQAPGLGAMRGSARLCSLAAFMASTWALTAGDAAPVSR